MSNKELNTKSDHTKNCFVVMPYGKDTSEQKYFEGWYEEVIKPSVEKSGYKSILASKLEHPTAINEDILSHLALDKMVVVDLGGIRPEDEPNPNVMYELGIRHAFGLSLVIMAWKGQKLPFDINTQRAIMEERGFLDMETNREKLITFIKAAEQNKFYRPMEAVNRFATMEKVLERPDETYILKALTKEIIELKNSVSNINSKYMSPLPTLADIYSNSKTLDSTKLGLGLLSQNILDDTPSRPKTLADLGFNIDKPKGILNLISDSTSDK